MAKARVGYEGFDEALQRALDRTKKELPTIFNEFFHQFEVEMICKARDFFNEGVRSEMFYFAFSSFLIGKVGENNPDFLAEQMQM
ncbi:MAG: hypothetical protein K0T99_03545 [Alphaproteobacteria bacterium]|nr:hypothetical protein [Alphaproteobacteria bacterium]